MIEIVLFTPLDQQVEEINPDKEVADFPLPEAKGKVKVIRGSLHFTNIANKNNNLLVHSNLNCLLPFPN